jgi:hypothetical protein
MDTATARFSSITGEGSTSARMAYRPAMRGQSASPGRNAQAVHLRLPGGELTEDAAEAQRVLAERGAHPVVAGSGRISLVKNQVDDLQDRGEARRPLRGARHLEGHLRAGEGLLCPDDALCNRRFRYQVGPR